VAQDRQEQPKIVQEERKMNNENTATAAATAVAVEVGAVKEVSELTSVLSFKEIAMPLVARGIPVIPIPPRQKGAVLKNWPDLATTNPGQVEAWNKQNPQYNCGAVAQFDGFWMLDCDVPDLQQTIEKETGEIFPQTFTVKSSKGLHFYFKHTAASRALKKNIPLRDEQGNVLGDVKVHNGYVVGPGSIHPSGKLYEVANESGIVDAPDWLVTWIKQKHQHAEADDQQYGASEEKILEGERNSVLFKRARKLSTSGLSQSDALTALRAINDDRCEPPLEETELCKIVESAYSYEPTNSALQDLIEKPHLPSPTDLGNAQRLVAAEGNNIRYCYENKKWYVWDGRIWSKDDSGKIYRLAKQTAKGMLHEAADLPDEEERKLLVSHEQRCESEGRLNAMVSVARWQEGVPIRLTDFDRDPMLLNCLNGTIDLSTGKVWEHRRENLISKMAEVEYKPEEKCPTWLEFVDTVANGSVELTEYLQRCVGYSLTGQTVEHALFLLYGTGANGKSTFLEVLRHIFADYSQTADFSSFLASNGQTVRNDLAKLNGARFVTASESDSGKRLDETIIKQMTGGDTVFARFLYSEGFEFTPQMKLWLGTNHKPTIRGQDEGVWRRIRLIPFTVSIPLEQQDHNLRDKLKQEASGILNWALEGLAQWHAKGLEEPAVVKDATHDYRTDQDVLAHFIATRCIEGSDVESPARDLYQAYKKWAEETNEYVVNERGFSNALSERGFQKVRHSGGNIWKGIGLASDSPW
jgi:putative DNA primase/helicase